MKLVYSLSLALGLLLGSHSSAVSIENMPDLHDADELESALKSLQSSHAEIMRVSELVRSREDRSVWLAEIGADSPDQRKVNPAVLIVAGLEGDMLADTEIALSFMQNLLSDVEESPDTRELLQNTTIYVIPRLNPDAAQRYFMQPMQEMAHNTTPHDKDNDRFVDEDGPDDLNNDQLITSMRVEDPKGKYIAHPDDERILIEADPIKGETGKWIIYSEGRDDDGDEEINEDPLGGVNFNQNFPFAFPWFTPHAGRHSVSEAPTRALAQFVVDHPNIAVVMAFSNLNTLYKAPESGDRSSGRTPQEKVVNEDAKWYEQLGKLFREKLELDKTLDLDQKYDGDFAAWMYFHKGRISLSAPVWSPEIALALKDSLFKENEEDEDDSEEEGESEDQGDRDQEPDQADEGDEDQGDSSTESESPNEENGENGEKKDEKQEEEKRGKTEREYLQWLDEIAPDYFVDWQEVDHPDFLNQTVEVGGFAPFARTLPPAQVFEQLRDSHVSFLRELIEKVPRVQIAKVELKPRGSDVYDMTVLVQNTGFLPTVLRHGERTGEILPTRVEIDLPQDAFLAGKRRTTVGPLAGSGGTAELKFTLRITGSDQIQVNVISALAGRHSLTVELN